MVSRGLSLFLKFLALVIVVIAIVRVGLGTGADVTLGASVPAAGIDATIDSQERFYATVYVIYAVLLWMLAQDFQRYRPLFAPALILFFAGGLARILSIVLVGPPAPSIYLLLALELALPPLLWFWTASVRKQTV